MMSKKEKGCKDFLEGAARSGMALLDQICQSKIKTWDH